MNTKILHLFTRTPLHVGAGASVGAIDQPVQRERHTGFPIIPASSLKGTFADEWNERVVRKQKQADGSEKEVEVIQRSADGVWLFGSDDANAQCSGSLLFSEARLLAFPVRSARGGYAWITCPLMLQRAKRDGVLQSEIPPDEPDDDSALFQPDGPLALQREGTCNLVLEEYCFSPAGDYPAALTSEIAGLVADEVFASASRRLAILSNGVMAHFASTACEVAQHVRISDETGTAEGTGLFNQENVPADTLFYSLLKFAPERGSNRNLRSAETAEEQFQNKLDKAGGVFQFGGDASTGMGYCSVSMH